MTDFILLIDDLGVIAVQRQHIVTVTYAPDEGWELILSDGSRPYRIEQPIAVEILGADKVTVILYKMKKGNGT